MTGAALYARAEELRAVFDRSFAALPLKEQHASEDLIALSVADRPHALRARDISGLFMLPRVLKLPTQRRELLGIAAIRSALVPVYDLCALLELGASTAPPRWLALCGQSEPLGLAFHELDGLLRVTPESVTAAEIDTQSGLPTRVLRTSSQTYPIVEVMPLLKKLKGPRAAPAVKER